MLELGFVQRAADEVMFMDAGRIAHRAPVGDFFSNAVPERVERFLNRMRT
jgi:ABC-type polar amino acid transport system ATPase subunit